MSDFAINISFGLLAEYDVAIFGLVIITIGITCIFVAKGLIASDKRFEENSIPAVGTIYNYRNNDSPIGGDIPKIAVRINGEDKHIEVSSKGMDYRTHPKGTQVRLRYRPIVVMGVHGFDARIDEDGYRSNINKITATLFYVLGGILIVIGVFLVILNIVG
jgi:hypothetical protein